MPESSNLIADDIREYTSGLRILCVSASLDFCKKFADQYGSFFKNIELVNSAEAALKAHHANRPDLMILTYPLPDWDIFDFLDQLKSTPDKTPTIIRTDFINMEFVSKSLEHGILRFIPLHATVSETITIIGGLAREIFARRTLSTLLNQEMELLRYRTRYHSQQQEIALRKEQHLLRNDLPGGMFMSKNSALPTLLLGICHKPHDIMCGDAYMVRKLKSGELLIFLVDAMGSGLSASLTSVCATSCVNFLIDLYEREDRFDFHRLIDCFLAHCRTILLDDEVVSFGFMHINPHNLRCNVALFGLPPIYTTAIDGTANSVRCANPPATNFTETWRDQTLSLDSLSSLLFYSDGLSDAETSAAVCYGQRLMNDMCETFLAAELHERFKQSVNARDDDMTFIRLSLLPQGERIYGETVVSPSSAHISKTISAIETRLATICTNSDWIDSLSVAMGEALLNALEHGCLGMGGAKKQQLMAEGSYDKAIEQTAENKSIVIAVDKVSVGKNKAVWITIRDSGNGFNLLESYMHKPASSNFQGRGKAIIKNLVNGFFYNYEGNCACLLSYYYQ